MCVQRSIELLAIRRCRRRRRRKKVRSNFRNGNVNPKNFEIFSCILKNEWGNGGRCICLINASLASPHCRFLPSPAGRTLHTNLQVAQYHVACGAGLTTVFFSQKARACPLVAQRGFPYFEQLRPRTRA